MATVTAQATTKCPYCANGKIKGMEADSAGKKEYATLHDCDKCKGTGNLSCHDADGKNLTLGDKVKLEFTVGNLHPHPDGSINVEIVMEGERSHFAIVNSKKLHKV